MSYSNRNADHRPAIDDPHPDAKPRKPDPDEARPLGQQYMTCEESGCSNVAIVDGVCAAHAGPPQALLLAASDADAEVLRRGAFTFEGLTDEENARFWTALERARIVSAADYVCLPRAGLEAWLEKHGKGWTFADGFGLGESAVEPLYVAELRALLAQEAGKGEG